MQRFLNIWQPYIGKIRYKSAFEKTMLTRSAQVVEKYGIKRWFKKNPSMRTYHADIVKFIKKRMNSSSVILETGCGIGQTFVILSRYGFKNFIGAEKDRSTWQAAKEFLSFYGIEVRLLNDNGLNVLNWLEEESVDIYLPLNWTFSTPEMEKIFDIGWKVLRLGGLMIIDIIRKDFVPQSEKERNVYVNYPYKYSVDEIRTLAVKKKFQILALDQKYGCRFNLYLKKSV